MRMMSSQDNASQMISIESLEQMKLESYSLIERLSDTDMDNYGKCKLFLYDSSRIEYSKLQREQIDRFANIVKKYGKVFVHLIQNLKSESIIERIETDHVTGGIDFQMTRSIRKSGNGNVVCISYVRNVFTPENILLGAVILGIGTLAEKFKARRHEWDPKGTDNFHMDMLNNVSAFAHFLQKDRFVSKLIRNYHENYSSIETLLVKVQPKINYGKIGRNYLKLIQFLQMWKYWDKILSGGGTLDITLRDFMDNLKEDKIYEIWLVYKILDSFGGMKQKNKRIFGNGKYEIVYQWSKKIGWRKSGGGEVYRRPDILVRKNGKVVAMIDAKYMAGNDLLPSTGEGSMPDSEIVNQMIIAMDYGAKKNNVDLGIVLFADKNNVPVTIEKINGKKKIHFLSMHPENNPKNSLEELKKIIP